MDIPAFTVGDSDDGESSSTDVEDALNTGGWDPLVEIERADVWLIELLEDSFKVVVVVLVLVLEGRSVLCQFICTNGAQTSIADIVLEGKICTLSELDPAQPQSITESVEVAIERQDCHPDPGYTAHSYPLGQHPTAVSPASSGNWKSPANGAGVAIEYSSFAFV